VTAYLRLVGVRLRRALDGNRRDRVPAGGSVRITLVGDPEAVERAGGELAAWLGQAFRVVRGEASLCVGEEQGASARRIELAPLGPTPGALRAATWSALA
jgi:hypothetical protein